MAKYEIELHSFKKKLNQIMIKKGLVNKRGNADPIKLYNLLNPNDQITEDMLKRERLNCMDKVRKLSNWIRGCNYPKTIVDILSLCNALDCDLDYFFTDMEAPTHDLQFISDEMGLPVPVIERLINYDEDIKHIFTNLIDCPEIENHPDLLNNLLLNILYYSMRTNETKVVLKYSLFDSDEEVNDSGTINEMLKYSSIQALSVCLDSSALAMRNKKNHIYDLKLQLKQAEINLLTQKLADRAGRTKEEIEREIDVAIQKKQSASNN